MKARFEDISTDPLPTSPAEFGGHLADETEKWAKVVRFAGVKAD
jgi:hypothetical protein